MPDRRDASRIRHAMLEMVMARVCGMGMSRKGVLATYSY
jgi:hypothetical protein